MKYMLVSACLLGVRCRYDGTKKADEGVLKLLGRKDVTLIPVCPEQLGGMRTPRAASESKMSLHLLTDISPKMFFRPISDSDNSNK